MFNSVIGLFYVDFYVLNPFLPEGKGISIIDVFQSIKLNSTMWLKYCRINFIKTLLGTLHPKHGKAWNFKITNLKKFV